MLHPTRTLRCGDRLVDLSRPLVMGILNITPDSFYDGGRYQKEKDILHRAEEMVAEGAAILDLGAMSSRPGADIISPEEEWKRLEPGLVAVRRSFPEVLVSVDTVHALVAGRSVEAGADLINDISAGLLDPDMFGTVARLRVPYILMHMPGNPKTMGQLTRYEDVVLDVLDFLTERVGRLQELGLTDLVLDPGFGFGKTLAQNYELLRNLHQFTLTGLPVLAGISRKSMIGKVLQTQPADSLNGTTALHMVALQQGASLLRVHDVREAVEVVRLWEQLGSPRFSQVFDG